MISVLQKIIFCFAVIIGLWVAGFFWFINQIPSEPSDITTQTDAIVVLTGGDKRIQYGLAQLSLGRGKMLFITGVGPDATIDNILREAPSTLRAVIKRQNKPIFLGHEAENTIGNAEETARWLRQQHVTSIRLVTANYHMPRSLSEFETALPGIQIIPDPVQGDEFSLTEWWHDADDRELLLSEYHKYLAALLRHWALSLMHRS